MLRNDMVTAQVPAMLTSSPSHCRFPFNRHADTTASFGKLKCEVRSLRCMEKSQKSTTELSLYKNDPSFMVVS